MSRFVGHLLGSTLAPIRFEACKVLGLVSVRLGITDVPAAGAIVAVYQSTRLSAELQAVPCSFQATLRARPEWCGCFPPDHLLACLTIPPSSNATARLLRRRARRILRRRNWTQMISRLPQLQWRQQMQQDYPAALKTVLTKLLSRFFCRMIEIMESQKTAP